MNRRHANGWSRREFLGGLVLAGAAGVLGLKPELLAAEPPPETTRLRLIQAPSVCLSPQYMAAELLQSEGFTEVQYLKKESVAAQFSALASGEIDINIGNAAPAVIRLDTGDPITILAGGHVGCFELFGTERVRAIHDLKGKTVAVPELGSSQHVFLASIATYVGLDPRQDIHWLTRPRAEAMQLLAEGKIDAYLGFPPDPQELQAKHIGHVVLNSALDRPWSQYFCCLVAGNRDFVRKYPVATKRALRAILKATTVCALQPEHAAHFLVDKGLTQRYDYALQALKDIPYGKWAEYNPEDTVRFYAPRLHEAGMIKSTPQKLIAEGTDWRFLNEIKKELKG